MRRMPFVISAIGAALLLGGCGEDIPGVEVTDSGGDSAGGETATVKQGQTVSLDALHAGDSVVTIRKITRDAPCPSGAPAEKGSYLQIDVTAEPASDDASTTGFSSLTWAARTSDGREVEVDAKVSAAQCSPKLLYPLAFGSEGSTKGVLFFDAPEDTSALVGRVAFISPPPALTIELPTA